MLELCEHLPGHVVQDAYLEGTGRWSVRPSLRVVGHELDLGAAPTFPS